MIRSCTCCCGEFDDRSPAKHNAGGLITHCPDCSEETAVRYVGVQAGEGKQSGLQVLAFNSDTDRKLYTTFWKVNSGYFKGKECQMSRTMTTPNVRFRIVAENRGNANHKGRT